MKLQKFNSIKHPVFVLAVIFLCFQLINSCKIYNYLFVDEPRKSAQSQDIKLSKIINSALYNIDFGLLRAEPENFVGKEIRIFGTIVDEFEGEFLLYTDPYEDNEYGFYRVLIDNPLPKQKDASGPFIYIGEGRKISIFGKFIGLTTFKLSEIQYQPKSKLNPNIDYSRLKNIPTIEASVIYDYDDIYHRNPFWLSNKLLEE